MLILIHKFILNHRLSKILYQGILMPEDHIQSNSLNISELKLRQLKEILPEAFSEGRVDTDKLKMALGEQFFIKDEHYELSWAGKTEAFKVLQQPTTATLAPVESESVNFDTTKNIFIEGENLEVLKILQKSYFGKIKMIYIDPPYNTGNDSFIYPDKFSESKDEYLKRIGSKDEEGYLTKDGFFRKNSKDNGHYHSNWLTMMYPRLYLARNLLRDDGVIFVSIDDNEVHNLRAVMNEIFGEENFVAQLIWRKKAGGGSDSKYFAIEYEYILVYLKNSSELLSFDIPYTEEEEKRFEYADDKGKYYLKTLERPERLGSRPNLQYPLTCPDGTKLEYKSSEKKFTWVVSSKKYIQMKNDGEIIFNKTRNGEWRVYRKVYMIDQTPRGLLYDLALNRAGTEILRLILGNSEIFSNPKPYELVKHLIHIATNQEKQGIIFDFFSGSGTTAQAVLELNKEDGGNRKFICVQLPEKTEEDSEAHKAGYKTIADIGKERIRRVIYNIQKEITDKPELFNDKNIDLGFKAFKLKHSNFKLWRGDIIENEEDLKTQMDAFENPKMEGAKEFNVLYELMLKTGCTLSDKVETKENYYAVNDGELIVAAKAINESVIKNIISDKPKKVIILDELFENNDQLKTNTALQMKDAGIEFRTV